MVVSNLSAASPSSFLRRSDVSCFSLAWLCSRILISRRAAPIEGPALCSEPRSIWMILVPLIFSQLLVYQSHKYLWLVSRISLPYRTFVLYRNTTKNLSSHSLSPWTGPTSVLLSQSPSDFRTPIGLATQETDVFTISE